MSTESVAETVVPVAGKPKPPHRTGLGPSLPQRRAEQLMGLALAAARTTPAGDVPVGCVITGERGEVLSLATNRREADTDPTAHAEVLAIRQAAAARGNNWRLDRATLTVTLEPCPMCAGAIAAARIGEVIFGAWEDKTGAMGSVTDPLREQGATHTPQITGGIRSAECAELLKEFFAGLRR